jgi:succinyl-diaminopimelate desuccinylase
MEVVGFFRKLGADFEPAVDDSFDLPVSTVNFGQLRQRLGGIDIQFDLRLLPDQRPEDVERRIVEGMQSVASRFPSLNIAVARERANAPLSMTANHDLVRICREAMEAAHLPVSLAKTSATTEAAQFFQAGYEAVVFGPGAAAGNSHGPNEYVTVEQMEKATAFYEKVIERACL